MILTNELRAALLDAQDRRWAHYPKLGTLLEEAIELLTFGDIRGWTPKRDAKNRPPDSVWLG